MKKEDRKKIEDDLNHLLTEGELNKQQTEKKVIKNLTPRYEIRIQAEKDPIKEETKLVQKTVVETNERYLRYVENKNIKD